jgi:hypothetical protein
VNPGLYTAGPHSVDTHTTFTITYDTTESDGSGTGRVRKHIIHLSLDGG